ncbi:hypothetical protein ACQUW5_07335 [Legionella sp. CNM-1927-20]|uniref:hypothetical protein n=1 Tax=Legionella sp. CNM-1927-20 TaxID=3422221 RepID=UPI00403B2FB6
MRAKDQLFFPKVEITSLEEQKLADLEEIRKICDAQLQYNKNLFLYLIQSENNEEVFEVIVSMYLSLSTLPQAQSLPKPEHFKPLKTSAIQGLKTDIQDYNQFAEHLSKGQIDELYLCMYYKAQGMHADIFTSNPRGIELMLSHFYKEKDLAKQLRKKLYAKQSPAIDEYHVLKKMIELLEPYVSPACLKYKDEIKYTSFAGTQDLGRLDSKPINLEGTTYRRAMQFLNENPNSSINSELKLLLQEYEEAYREFLEFNQNQVSTNLLNTYLATFKYLKPKYEAEAKINKLLKSANDQMKTLEITSFAEEKTQPELPPEVEPHLSVNPAKPESSRASAVISEAIEEEAIEEKVQEEDNTLKNNIAIPMDDNDGADNNAEKDKEIVDREKIDVKAEEESSEEVDSACEKKEIEQETIDYTDKMYTQYYKKKDKEINKNKHVKGPVKDPSPVETKHNILKLDEDDQATLLKVFSDKPEDSNSITLRELMHLTISGFKGKFKKPQGGSNTCKLEIKNIYAHLLVPKEAIDKTYGSASLSWHGKGLGRNRSNKSAKGLPPYVIPQFREACKNAGYTPENLGLVTTNNSTNSQGKGCIG